MYFILVYMYIYFQKKKKIQDFQIFPKKREKISKKKKKINKPILGALDFLVTFSKEPIFFQRFQDSLKSSFQNGT